MKHLYSTLTLAAALAVSAMSPGDAFSQAARGRDQVCVYEHADFQGQRLVVEGDIEDLTQVSAAGGSNWNDSISSLRVEGGRRGGRRN